MRLKEWFKSNPNAKRGALIGLTIPFLFWLLSSISAYSDLGFFLEDLYDNFIVIQISNNHCYFNPLCGLIAIILFFKESELIGEIIGFIIGKIKSKK